MSNMPEYPPKLNKLEGKRLITTLTSKGCLLEQLNKIEKSPQMDYASYRNMKQKHGKEKELRRSRER